MSGMARRILGTILAMALIGAHLPLPRGSRPVGAHDGGAACCAPKACCTAMGACTHGVGCAAVGAGPGGGYQLFAGGCGDQTPRVTPVSIDPIVTAQSSAEPITQPKHTRVLATDTICRSIAAQPLVPPPRV